MRNIFCIPLGGDIAKMKDEIRYLVFQSDYNATMLNDQYRTPQCLFLSLELQFIYNHEQSTNSDL